MYICVYISPFLSFSHIVCGRQLWLFSHHLALMIECFAWGDVKRTKYFGSYRVELVVLLFPRVVDLHNFELVMRTLNPYEAGKDT
jgi:hypothetical protein